MKTIKHLYTLFFMALLGTSALFLASCDDDDDGNDIIPIEVFADAGDDQTVNVGQMVTLDGSGSTITGATTLDYNWEFTSVPDGSAATLTNVNAANASFTPDVEGDYVVQLTVSSGDEEDTDEVTITAQPEEMPAAEYMQEDQMARPAINTVFVNEGMKDAFNTTVPSDMQAQFQADFEAKLLALNPGYTMNALGQDSTTFTTLLATDVLNVSTTGTTTFFDGTNVLTGRALADDVIDTELLLIFGGPDGTSNPGLTSDNVSENDLDFLDTFPYLAAPHQ